MSKPKNTKKRLQKLVGILTLVQKMKGQNMKYLAENMSDESIEMLSECVFNATKTPRNPEQRNCLRKKLYRDREKTRSLAKSENELKKKRELIPQMGRGLGIIATILIPLLSSVIQGGIQAATSSSQNDLLCANVCSAQREI